MKLVILLFSLTFAHFAQASIAGDVCTAVASQSGSYGEQCVSVLSQGSISDAAASVCLVVAQQNYSVGPSCLQVVVNKQIDPGAAKVCASIAVESATYAQQCLAAIAGKSYSSDIINVCQTVANNNYSQGPDCLQNSGKPMSAAPPASTTAAPRCLSNQQILERLTVARYAIDHNRQVNASRILSDLEDSLRTCR